MNKTKSQDPSKQKDLYNYEQNFLLFGSKHSSISLHLHVLPNRRKVKETNRGGARRCSQSIKPQKKKELLEMLFS